MWLYGWEPLKVSHRPATTGKKNKNNFCQSVQKRKRKYINNWLFNFIINIFNNIDTYWHCHSFCVFFVLKMLFWINFPQSYSLETDEATSMYEKYAIYILLVITVSLVLQSNMYKTTTIGTTQKWWPWTGGRLINSHCECFANNKDLLE